MPDDDLATYVHRGASLVVATTGEDGTPRVGRAWGIAPLDVTWRRCRLVLDAADPLARVRAGTAIAVTAADVRTYRAVQVKGRVVGEAAAPTPEDVELHRTHVDAFTHAVVETDGTERRLLERLVPRTVVACDIEVDERYDQTPGPHAGSSLRR